MATPRTKDIIALILLLVLCIGGGAVSGLLSPPGEWYAQLNKPDWTPPGWIFGPVWTALYAMMAIAAWLVWRKRSEKNVTLPLIIFAVQLALNFAWSPLFFGLQRPDLALIDIVLLLIAIVATIILFAPISRSAAVLLTPYLAWVSFASVLNLALWRMNL
ncbi:MAG: tryptophan-rich sensory protein [Phycisphaerales bacterium]|nr:MAG: tryptophan-rich sensory protein [Phycisphaerales bacterium]